MNLDPFYEKSWKRKKKIDKVLYAFAVIALIIMAYNHCGKPEPKLVPSHGFNNIDVSATMEEQANNKSNNNLNSYNRTKNVYAKNILEELHKLP